MVLFPGGNKFVFQFADDTTAILKSPNIEGYSGIIF